MIGNQETIGDFRFAPIGKADGIFVRFMKGSSVTEDASLAFLMGASQIRDGTAQNRSFVQLSQ